jgi:peptide-methionine (R)-S-oxide reductase
METPAPMPRTDEEWQKILKPEQFRILRQHGTERPGSSPLDKNYAPGNYYCAGSKSTAIPAAAIWGTCFPMVPAPPANAIASMGWL